MKPSFKKVSIYQDRKFSGGRKYDGERYQNNSYLLKGLNYIINFRENNIDALFLNILKVYRISKRLCCHKLEVTGRAATTETRMKESTPLP